LEGFSPTPEMPEIAEAQALLGELSIPSVGSDRLGRRASVSSWRYPAHDYVPATSHYDRFPSAKKTGPMATSLLVRLQSTDPHDWDISEGEGFRTPAPSGKVVRMWGRGSKASQGGNRGWEGSVWSDAAYGDFGVADEALVGLRELVAGILRGGAEDDERVGGFLRGSDVSAALGEGLPSW
jgi:hypothetical protein